MARATRSSSLLDSCCASSCLRSSCILRSVRAAEASASARAAKASARSRRAASHCATTDLATGRSAAAASAASTMAGSEPSSLARAWPNSTCSASARLSKSCRSAAASVSPSAAVAAVMSTARRMSSYLSRVEAAGAGVRGGGGACKPLSRRKRRRSRTSRPFFTVSARATGPAPLASIASNHQHGAIGVRNLALTESCAGRA